MKLVGTEKLSCVNRRRVKPLEAAAHPFFDELRQTDLKLPNDVAAPALFNFTLQGTQAVTKECLQLE